MISTHLIDVGGYSAEILRIDHTRKRVRVLTRWLIFNDETAKPIWTSFRPDEILTLTIKH